MRRRHGAASVAVRLLAENAGRAQAAALTLNTAAQRLLTIEPKELRNPVLASQYANRAVTQTESQMPSYLVTLATAELAAGHPEEARKAAAAAVEGYRKVAEILAPVMDGAKYAEAARLYGEWRTRLEALAGQL